MLGAKTAMTIYDFSARLGTGEERPLADYRGKVLFIVNVASKYGFTPQYNGLQSLCEQFQSRGFEILAFPCDQFGHQEPGSDVAVVGAAPCQCFSPGGNQTTSPGRICSTGHETTARWTSLLIVRTLFNDAATGCSLDRFWFSRATPCGPRREA
jgi:hypothetical protein